MAPKSVNTYEESRKQRIEENKKCFENLEISKTLKCLAELQSSKKKSVKRHPKPKSDSIYTLEPRRSSRARNPVRSYRDDVDMELPHLRKRSRISSSWASYIARPLDECKTASYEERSQAFRSAENLQGKLTSGDPSFIKSMVRSHVYSCFWLGLPSKFCEEHLPKTTVDMVLESENGAEYDAVYIGKRGGLSGGWRAFALEHKLDDGDALVFELVEPARFKIYIVRAASCSSEEDDDTAVGARDSKSASSRGAEKPDKKSERRPKTRTKKDVGSWKASSGKNKKK